MQENIIIKLSDPWDLGEMLSWTPIQGKIEAVDGKTNKIIIQCSKPFTYKNIVCEYFIATPRHKENFFDLIHKKEIFCNFTLINEDQVKSKDKFNLDFWRGGVGIIGMLHFI